MPVGGAFVASQGQGPCADWRQLPLLQRTALRNGGESEIPCPTFSISYIGRKDQSVMMTAKKDEYRREAIANGVYTTVQPILQPQKGVAAL